MAVQYPVWNRIQRKQMRRKQGMNFDEAQIATMRSLRSVKVSYAEIARRFGCGTDKIRALLIPEYGEKRNAAARESRRRARAIRREKADMTKRVFTHAPARRTVPSQEILMERARAFSLEPTIGQMLLGDPRPGRSAWDKKRSD